MSIVDIPSRKSHLTFQILKNYLLSNNNHISDDTFLENYHLLTKEGHFNYLAEILADKNDIVINVAIFTSSDKTKYLRREEFGGKCLTLRRLNKRGLTHVYTTNGVKATIQAYIFIAIA